MNSTADAEFSAGVACWEKRDIANAMARFKAATALQPKEPRYWVWYGACLMELHHWREAARALRAGIDLKPAYGEADARLMLAQALVKSGDKRAAIAQLKVVVKMEPTYPSHGTPIENAKALLASLR